MYGAPYRSTLYNIVNISYQKYVIFGKILVYIQASGIPLGTNCALFVADSFLKCHNGNFKVIIA